MKIGFFDSGLGGLTILKAVAARLPEYDYEYLGDTANVPYGDKTEDEIYELTKKGVESLFARDCVLVIIACNTASAETLRQLQDTFLFEHYPDRRILGVIIPTIEAVINSGVERVLLIGTRRTVSSQKYERELAKFERPPLLTSVATPGLVPLLEAGKLDEAVELVVTAIGSFATMGEEQGSSGLILGCTHYTTLKSELAKRYPMLTIFSQDEIVPDKLEAYLEKHSEIEGKLSRGSTRTVVFSKQDSAYDSVIERLLGGVFTD